MSGKLYAIGYRGLEPDVFWDKLEGAGVNALLDLREKAWSSREEWRRDSLETLASVHNIRYAHIASLGNPYRSPKWEGTVSERRPLLLEYLKGPKPQTAIRRIHLMLDCGINTAIMCACNDHYRCHLAQVIEALEIKAERLWPVVEPPSQEPEEGLLRDFLNSFKE